MEIIPLIHKLHLPLKYYFEDDSIFITKPLWFKLGYNKEKQT